MAFCLLVLLVLFVASGEWVLVPKDETGPGHLGLQFSGASAGGRPGAD